MEAEKKELEGEEKDFTWTGAAVTTSHALGQAEFEANSIVGAL